jgi:hypothetical protein
MKEIIYNITQQTTGRVVVVSGLDEEFTKNNVLGIINKTQSKVLYTPVQAANMLSASYQDGTMTISLADNVQSINKGDELLVKLYSDKEIDLSAFAKESTLLAESQAVQSAIQNIDLSSVESKVEEVGNKIDNIKLPEIDTTELAKQGENQEATMSAVLEEVMKLNGSFAEQIHNIVGE